MQVPATPEMDGATPVTCAVAAPAALASVSVTPTACPVLAVACSRTSVGVSAAAATTVTRAGLAAGAEAVPEFTSTALTAAP